MNNNSCCSREPRNTESSTARHQPSGIVVHLSDRKEQDLSPLQALACSMPSTSYMHIVHPMPLDILRNAE
jgi:hypothetical protein